MVDNNIFRYILNLMVEYDSELSDILKAMSDSTRRALLTRLCQQGPTRVTDLANQYDMSLNAISKHIKVLEKVGLVTRQKSGKTHWIQSDLNRVSVVEEWFRQLKSIWELRLNKLDDLLTNGDKDND